jgi:hypothetical protein
MLPKKTGVYKCFAKNFLNTEFLGNMPTQITKAGAGKPPAPKTETEIELDFSTPPTSPTSPTSTSSTSPTSGSELEVEFGLDAAPPEAVPAVEEGFEVEFEEAEAPAPQATQATATAVTPAQQELVAIYLLAMHLPSADLVADDYTDESGNTIRRIKEWSGEGRKVAREIETMRRNIYRRIERLWCMVREFGVWVAVSEAGVREAERLSKEVREALRKVGLDQFAHRYFVKAIRVYLHPDDAKMLLDAAVDQLTLEVQELERRIKDAETARNRRLVGELIRKKEYVRALLDVFKKHVEDISR